MTRPLEGHRAALLETRQLDELARLLENEGAEALRYPLVAIHDHPDAEPIVAWLQEFTAGRFDILVLMTGEGVRRLHGFAERAGMRDEYVRALTWTLTVTRGPKPVQALKALEIAPGVVAPTPTTEGVIEALKAIPLSGKTVGVQLFDESGPELSDFLSSQGATERAILPYVYGPASDEEQVVELIHALAEGKIDIVAVTSRPQVHRLFAVAEARGLMESLQDGLKRTCVAAVGPVAAESLHERGVAVTVCPERGGFVMKKLVEYLKRHFATKA